MGGGVSDQLQVNGVARLAGTLQAVFQPGTYSRSTYTMLTASAGYTGTFTTLATQNLPVFLNASLGYNANTVTLSLQSSIASLSGLGGNQLAVAGEGHGHLPVDQMSDRVADERCSPAAGQT